jgi:lipopolysaccharide/colanic/teichoic acid biosynthesis glycosyltransferase
METKGKDSVRSHPITPSQPQLHRLFDLTLVAILSPAWTALILFLVGAILSRYGSPAIYRSERVGLGGRHFTILKFRTLDLEGQPLGRLASLLRTTHLDELPQLWNTLWGSMALVGPRPLLPEDHYSLGNYLERESVRPGMTGPWQINRTDKHDYSDMQRLDSEIIDDTSLRFRLMVLASTGGLLLRLLRARA